jgi:hypothetical protein
VAAPLPEPVSEFVRVLVLELAALLLSALPVAAPEPLPVVLPAGGVSPGFVSVSVLCNPVPVEPPAVVPWFAEPPVLVDALPNVVVPVSAPVPTLAPVSVPFVLAVLPQCNRNAARTAPAGLRAVRKRRFVGARLMMLSSLPETRSAQGFAVGENGPRKAPSGRPRVSRPKLT